MSYEPTPQRVIDRLLEKIEIDESGCWISLYSTGSHGYSQVGWQGAGGKTRLRLGHRVSWEALWGPIPDGLTIDHICRVRRCINPEHLRLMTNFANAQDNGQDGASSPVPTGRKCGKGLHELLRYPSGAVACRECANERSRRKRQSSPLREAKMQRNNERRRLRYATDEEYREVQKAAARKHGRSCTP